MSNQMVVQVDENGRKFLMDYFVYATNDVDIAAGATSTQTLQIDSECDFIVTKMSYFCDVAGAALTDSTRQLPLVNCLITDSGSGRNLFNRALPLPLICGVEGLPYNLTNGRLFRGNSIITFALNNFSAATNYANLVVALHGFKKLYI
jgi:hypothetical protein